MPKRTVACGDVGGSIVGDQMLVGLREENDSGSAGVAVLRGIGDDTQVTIYLALDSVARPSASGGDQAAEVVIGDDGFSPSVLEVERGSTVIWRNEGGVAHTITGEDLAFDDSGVLEPDQEFRQTFDEPGAYAYHCGPHPHMTGTIVVM